MPGTFRPKSSPMRSWIVLLFLCFTLVISEAVNDDDEFIHVTDAPPVPESTPDLSTGPAGTPQPSTWKLRNAILGGDDFTIEMALITFLIIAVIRYFMGKRENDRMAAVWINTFDSIFLDNFFAVGSKALLANKPSEPEKVATGDQEKKSPYLTAESPNEYFMYATGRQNCVGTVAKLELKPRHNLFALMWGFFSPSVDKVTVEVELNPADPICLAICRSFEEKKIRSDLYDIGTFAHSIKTGLNDSLVCMIDTDTAATHFLTQQVTSTLNKYSKFVRLLHITDQYLPKTDDPDNPIPLDTDPRRLLRVILTIPDELGEIKELATLLRMTVHLIDASANLSLSANAKERAAAARSKAHDARHKAGHADRQRRAEEMREKKEREEKERIKKLPAKEQEKIRERKKREDARRSGPRMKTMKVRM